MTPFSDKQEAYIKRLLDTGKRTRSEVVKIVRDVKEITLREAKKEVHFIKYRVYPEIAPATKPEEPNGNF